MGRGSTLYGSVAPSWLLCPPSSTWGEEVLCMDRWLHPGFSVHLPADVDLQAGVRRVRPIHCAPQVLLNLPRIPNIILYITLLLFFNFQIFTKINYIHC